MFKYIISSVLSLLIITVQVGLVYTTHICGGVAVLSELSIGSSDLHCGGGNSSSEEEKHCQNKNHFLTKKSCCQNSSLSLEVDDEFQKQSFSEIQITPILTHFIAWFKSDNDVKESVNQRYLAFVNTKDIPIWNQVFLI